MIKKAVVCVLLSIFVSGCATTFNGKAAGDGPDIVDLGNGVIQDNSSRLMWQKDRSKVFHSLAEASEYINSLQLGGFKDWRLPTIYELYNLQFVFDFKSRDNAGMDSEGSYWSSAGDGKGSAGAWEVGGQCELERNYFMYSSGYVRAVRSINL